MHALVREDGLTQVEVAELLEKFPFTIDWGAKAITFYPPGHQFEGGTIVPLSRGFGGLLLRVPFKFNGEPVVGVIDTGCPISYMPVPQGTEDGTADDFYCGFGTWTTRLYRNRVRFGNRTFDAKFGIIPDGCALKTVTPWLCGAEFLKSGPMGFDIARNRLHLFSNSEERREPMADRAINGVVLPSHKAVVIALTTIYGIGRTTAAEICRQAGLDGSRKVRDLSDDEFGLLQGIVGTYRTEGDLRDTERGHIAELVRMKSVRGLRHAKRKG